MENLVELKSNELQEIEGGFWPYVIGALVGAAFSQDFDDLAAAFNEGGEAYFN